MHQSHIVLLVSVENRSRVVTVAYWLVVQVDEVYSVKHIKVCVSHAENIIELHPAKISELIESIFDKRFHGCVHVL